MDRIVCLKSQYIHDTRRSLPLLYWFIHSLDLRVGNTITILKSAAAVSDITPLPEREKKTR